MGQPIPEGLDFSDRETFSVQELEKIEALREILRTSESESERLTVH